MILWRL